MSPRAPSLFVCLACAKSKRSEPAPAADLYTSPLFRLSLAYAQRLDPDGIFVLSAEHGLLPADSLVAPYDRTLARMPAAERTAWSARVLADLRTRTDPERDRFVFLAGRLYRDGLLPHLCNAEAPLAGLGLGRQLAWLKAATEPEARGR